MQDMTYIECFCEECCISFKSFIAKDLCPVCEKLMASNIETREMNFEKIQKTRKLRDD